MHTLLQVRQGHFLRINQTSISGLSSQTSASHVPTVVQNLRQLDDTCLTVAPPARTQPQPVVNLIATPLRPTAAKGVAANLSTTGIPTVLQPTVTSSHPPYLPLFRRRDVDPRQPLGRALDTNGPHKNTMRTSALIPNAVTKGNSLPPPSAYLAMGDDLDRVAVL